MQRSSHAFPVSEDDHGPLLWTCWRPGALLVVLISLIAVQLLVAAAGLLAVAPAAAVAPGVAGVLLGGLVLRWSAQEEQPCRVALLSDGSVEVGRAHRSPLRLLAHHVDEVSQDVDEPVVLRVGADRHALPGALRLQELGRVERWLHRYRPPSED